MLKVSVFREITSKEASCGASEPRADVDVVELNETARESMTPEGTEMNLAVLFQVEPDNYIPMA